MNKKFQIPSLTESSTKRMVSEDGHFLEVVEDYVGSLSANKKKKGPKVRKSKIDSNKYKRQVISIVRSLDRMSSSQAYWHVGSVVGQVQDLITKAHPFLENGDGESAVQILTGIAEGYAEEWTYLDGSDGETPNPFYDLDEGFAEALLVCDIDKKTKSSLKENIEKWSAELSDYGVDDAFCATALAMDEGWSNQNIVDSLNGKVVKNSNSNQGNDTGHDFYYSRDPNKILNAIRLNILRREGRSEEYMNFALSQGLICEFFCMKIDKGEIKESALLAKKHLDTGKDALEIIKKLREAKALNQALEIGELGLEFSDYNDHLGDYLCDFALNMKNKKLALKAIQKAFYDTPTLKRYVASNNQEGFLSYHSYYKALKRYCREAEVNYKIATHGLRHSTSGIYIKHGATADDLQTLFLHSSSSVTERCIHQNGSEKVNKIADNILLFPKKSEDEFSEVSQKIPNLDLGK